MKMPELLPPPDTMYRALLNRDSSFEGIFYAGVRTTGIFCRPTCSAKKPERVNVDFFATPSEALHRGYRPCLRCHPMDPDQPPPKLIARLRAEVDRAPDGRLTDKELAAMSIDPSTARRQFKRHYGMTFQAYHRARRMGLALREVRKGERVGDVRNGSGFDSESGFRDAFTRIFGEPPTAAKAQGGLFAERIETPLGAMIDVRWSASCRSCDTGFGPMSFPENIGISMPFVLHWPIIFRERISASMFLWHRLVRRFNFVPGNCCVQFQSAKRALIPGWRRNSATSRCAARSGAPMART